MTVQATIMASALPFGSYAVRTITGNTMRASTPQSSAPVLSIVIPFIRPRAACPAF
jgi:hypothetical protein